MKLKETFLKLKSWMDVLIRRLAVRFDAEKKYDIDAAIQHLYDNLAVIKSRLPPEGWCAVNFHLVEDPSYSIVIDVRTRVWSVWRGGEFVCEGPTLEECARKFRAEHHVR